MGLGVLLIQMAMMSTQINEQMHCCLFSEKQGYQLCKCDAASFNMICDVQYANTEQYLVNYLCQPARDSSTKDETSSCT